jgi:hypothetical protein
MESAQRSIDCLDGELLGAPRANQSRDSKMSEKIDDLSFLLFVVKLAKKRFVNIHAHNT